MSSNNVFDFREAMQRVAVTDPIGTLGKIVSVVGLCIRAVIPGGRVGDLVWIQRSDTTELEAEIVGFEGDRAILLAFGATRGIACGDPVRLGDGPLRIRCSQALLGRILDGCGRPLDGRAQPDGDWRSIHGTPPPPLQRKCVTQQLSTGVRAIDGLLTLGRGQRVGLFSGSGVGKSALLGRIARGTDADCFVICLLGERSRELLEMVHETLGPENLRRGVIVYAASDAPALFRMKSAHVATTIAEWFRDQGEDVLLLVDNLTRFARAAREVGLAAGEPPTRRGFPPSVFAALPELVERAGPAEHGSITGIYTVLVEGNDLEEPITDEVRGILDGHITLCRSLADRGHFPAIDVLRSLSRMMPRLIDDQHQRAAAALRQDLAVLEEHRDLIAVGAYQSGTRPALDRALRRLPRIEKYLRQNDVPTSLEQALAALDEFAESS